MTEKATAPGVPIVSVVIAALNAEATLGEQLAALADQQSPTPFEVVVCDNGSTDGTAAVVTAWQGRVPGLRLVDAAGRRGAAAARNAGAAVARGSRLAFCDADDVVAPGWVAAMAEALSEHDLVAGQVEVAVLDPHNPAVEVLPPSVFRIPEWPDLPACGAGYLGVRTTLFAGLGGFEESLLRGEDVDLCWRAQVAGVALVSCPEAVVHIRARAGLLRSFRQAFADGRAGRALARRWAGPRAAALGHRDRERLAAALEPRPGDATGALRQRNLLRRGRRFAAATRTLLRSPVARVAVAERVGRWCGSHLGRVDRRVPRVSLDASQAGAIEREWGR